MFQLEINGNKGNHSALKIFYNENSISDHKKTATFIPEVYVNV